MPPQKKYTMDISETIAEMKFLLGTPQHAFHLLRLDELGFDWDEFYQYMWRRQRAKPSAGNALAIMWGTWKSAVIEWIDTKGRKPRVLPFDDHTLDRARYYLNDTSQDEDEKDEGTLWIERELRRRGQ